jgi:predicted metal-binding membrane protein
LSHGEAQALSRERLAALVSLVLITGFAWLYLFREAASMGRGTMDMGSGFVETITIDAATYVTAFVMWTVMMVGMMLPSAAPAILLYASLVRKNAARGVSLASSWIFTAGYLAAWTAFSAAATVLQLELQRAGWLGAGMASANTWLSAGILLAAGIYQWLPVKAACLSRCSHPVHFLLTHWRAGRLGALRMGAEHGAFCVGCCWVLMLVLFVGGVMNLLLVALIGGFVFLEKALPAGRLTSRVAGTGLVGSAVAFVAFG